MPRVFSTTRTPRATRVWVVNRVHDTRDLLDDLIIMLNDLLAALKIAYFIASNACHGVGARVCDEVSNHILVAEEIAEFVIGVLEELREAVDA